MNGTATPYLSRIDRRTTLAWLGAGSALAFLPWPSTTEAAASAASGYGADPNLLHPSVPWPRILSADQLQTAALICDFILPASTDAPSASGVGVPDFIDEWVSAPYPLQSADRPVILDGLKWVGDEAMRRHGTALLQLASADRAGLLQQLVPEATEPALAAPHAFFRRFHALTVGAYYTTSAGFRDIGYIGNVPMASYPGPSAEVKAVLDARLKTLGL